MTATATITEIELLTAEHIAVLFRKHDIIPRQSIYLALPVIPRQSIYLALPGDLSTCLAKCAACAVGILLVEARGSASRARSCCTQSYSTVKRTLKAETEIPPSFVDGLDDGFSLSSDNKTWEEGYAQWAEMDGDRDDSLYAEGFRVGWRAWELANVTEEPSAEAP